MERVSRIAVPSGAGHSVFGLENLSPITGMPSVQPASASEPLRVRYTSEAEFEAVAGLVGTTLLVWNGKNVSLVCWAKPLSLSNVRNWVAISNASLSLFNEDNPAELRRHAAGFRASTPASDSTWTAVTSDGRATKVTDTGVSFNTTGHEFRIEVDDQQAKILFYIDGNLVATHAQNLPGSVGLTPVVGARTLQTPPSVAVEFEIGPLALDSDL